MVKCNTCREYELLALSRMTGEQIENELSDEEREDYWKLSETGSIIRKCFICGESKIPRYFVDGTDGQSIYFCGNCVDNAPKSDEGLAFFFEAIGLELGEFDIGC